MFKKTECKKEGHSCIHVKLCGFRSCRWSWFRGSSTDSPSQTAIGSIWLAAFF